MKGFLLGLTNGTACLAYCAPVLFPLLLAEQRSPRQSFAVLAQFLAGRLAGYLTFAVLAGYAGLLLASTAAWREFALGGGFVALAVMLAAYGFRRDRKSCEVNSVQRMIPAKLRRWPVAFFLLAGFLTGLNLCPPFLLALVSALETGSVGGSVWLFFTFFLGTSVYFLPLPFVGALARFEALRLAGRLAVGLVGFYYFYQGVILIRKGIALL